MNEIKIVLHVRKQENIFDLVSILTKKIKSVDEFIMVKEVNIVSEVKL